MEMREMLAVIDNVVTQNRLDVHRSFSADYIGRNGFYDDAQEVAQLAVSKIMEACIVGVNSGFNRDTKNLINDLSKVVVALTTLSNGDSKKIRTYREQVERVRIRADAPQGNDPRDAVRSYAKTTIGAIEAILENKEMFGATIDQYRPYMEKIKDKLGELLYKLDGITNYTSKQAAEKAAEIIGKILNIRLSLSPVFCTPSEVIDAEEALSLMDQWTKLATATDRKTTAEKDKIPTYRDDDITTLSNSVTSLQTFELFRKSFESTYERIMHPAGQQALQDRLKKTNDELNQIEGDQFKLVQEYQSGIITEYQFSFQAEQLADRETRLKEEKNSLLYQLNEYEADSISQKDIVETFRREIYTPMMRLKDDDPMTLCVLVELMDFKGILKVVNSGRFTQGDLQAAMQSLTAARTLADERKKSLGTTIGYINNVLGLLQNQQQSRREAPRVIQPQMQQQTQQTQQQTRSDAAQALLNKFGANTAGGNGGQQQQQPQQQTQQQPQQQTTITTPQGGIRLSDDDK